MGNYDPDKIMERIGRYCAYQDRCESEVRTKLRSLFCPPDEADRIIDILQEQGFLDEARYARAFVRGKFRQNRWGRMKIAQALRVKNISASAIDAALSEELDPDTYREVAAQDLRRKAEQLQGEDPYEKRMKAMRFMAGRGFELDLLNEVWED